MVADTPWYVMACVPFIKSHRLKFSYIFALGFLAGLVKAVSGGLLIVIFPDTWRNYNIFHYVLHTLLLLFVYIVAFKEKPVKLVYSLLLLQAIATTVNFVAGIVVSYFYPGVIVSMSTIPMYTVAMAIGIAIIYPFVWHFFNNQLRFAFEELPSKSLVLLCVAPILFYFLNQIFVVSVQSAGIPTNKVALLTVLILATGLGTYYVNLKTVLDNARNIKQESESEKRLALQAQNYENLTQSIAVARAARHDLRHHLNVLHDCVENKDYDRLNSYINQYIESLPHDSKINWCENETVNALLKHYLGIAQQANVELDIKINLPYQTDITNTDLCVVFGNIFENAATSASTCGAQGLIRSRCVTNDREIILTVENTIGNLPLKGMGIGLHNVLATAKKNHGSAEFSQKDGVYYSNVILTRGVKIDS